MNWQCFWMEKCQKRLLLKIGDQFYGMFLTKSNNSVVTLAYFTNGSNAYEKNNGKHKFEHCTMFMLVWKNAVKGSKFKAFLETFSTKSRWCRNSLYD